MDEFSLPPPSEEEQEYLGQLIEDAAKHYGVVPKPAASSAPGKSKEEDLGNTDGLDELLGLLSEDIESMMEDF